MEMEKREFLPRERWLNFALILGPAAWVLHLNVSYMLVPESCGDKTKMMLHVVTVVCVVLALIGAAIAWRIRAASVGESLSADRTRWTATMVLLLSLSMVVVILAQQIPNFILRSCD
jgi:uncharacterized Tic20 family protein